MTTALVVCLGVVGAFAVAATVAAVAYKRAADAARDDRNLARAVRDTAVTEMVAVRDEYAAFRKRAQQEAVILEERHRAAIEDMGRERAALWEVLREKVDADTGAALIDRASRLLQERRGRAGGPGPGAGPAPVPG